MQEGYVGLLMAALTFDPTKAKFITYAYRPIYWNILKYVQKQQKYNKLINEYKQFIQDRG